ncbi:MAG: FtsX-like permease family protein, partial [Actinobacteria bacterium]|nr:FtsX-like permease family protein [Actinomycetota bacterium]
LDDLVWVSLRQVVRHRRRYWGAVLAIAVGVAGFISIITMGQDVKKNFNLNLDLIGGVTIFRNVFEPRPPSPQNWFRENTAEAIRALPGVKTVSLVGGKTLRTSLEGQEKLLQVAVVDEHFWDLRSLYPLTGALFGPEEVKGSRRVVVLGKRLAETLFGGHEVAGRTLEIDQDIYQVIGVVGGLRAIDLDKSAFVPLTTARHRFSYELTPTRLYVRCLTWDDVPQVAAAIPGVVAAHQPDDNLLVEVDWENLAHVKQTSWWIEFFIYLAFAATLILGGLGIWSIMMAAVRSRTREIGLKKAMGAEDADILAQFLTESLCLSLLAALAGVALGRLLVELLGWWIGMRPPEELFLTCLVFSLIFAVALGVGAGLYPSLQAARMEVVSATRYE